MKSNPTKRCLQAACCLFLLFAALIAAVRTVDVRSIGPEGSSVGLAALNEAVFRLTGVQWFWYTLTDWLGILAILTAMGFAVLGLVQLIRRRSFQKVDGSLYVLGGVYLLTIGCYLLFEIQIVNYRPVLMQGVLEASFPSSHTMIVCTIMATALLEFRARIRNKARRTAAELFCAGLMAVTVLGRLVSGVHWFTDILGGLLLSGTLTALYAGCVGILKKKAQETRENP